MDSDLNRDFTRHGSSLEGEKLVVLGLREAVLECSILDMQEAVMDRLATYYNDLNEYELGRNEVRRLRACCEELKWVLKLLDKVPV